MGTSKGGGKQWQPTPKKPPRMQCRLTGLWFLLKPAFGLNTNDDDIYKYRKMEFRRALFLYLVTNVCCLKLYALIRFTFCNVKF